LFKFINFHCFSNVGIKNVFLSHIIALFSDFLLCFNNFIFDLKCAETEFTELFGEIVWRNLYHAKIRWLLNLRYWRQLKLSGDQIVVLSSNMLVKNNFVHGFSKISIYFAKERGGIS